MAAHPPGMKPRKLRLHKQTLRNLSRDRLAEVRGGRVDDEWSRVDCTNTCVTQCYIVQCLISIFGFCD